MNRIAAVFLLLIIAPLTVSAQTYTTPFQINGSTVTTTAGTFGDGTGLDEPNANYTSFTIGAQTTISSSTAYGGDNLNPPGIYLIHTSTSIFTNLGNLTFTASTYYQSVVFLDQGALSLTASNSGTITTEGGIDNTQSALYITSTTGNITLGNTGTLATHTGNGGQTIFAQSTSGNIAITNSVGATISADENVGRGVTATTAGSGTLGFINAGTINVGQDATDLTTENGALSASNSGNITASNVGLRADSNAGVITLSNTGTIGVSGGYAMIGDTDDASITATNSGTITLSSAGIGLVGTDITARNSGDIDSANGGIIAEQSGPGTVYLVNTGTLTGGAGIIAYQDSNTTPTTVTNSGLISTTGAGIYLYYTGTVINSGSINSSTDAITVPSGSSVVLQGRPDVTGTISGGADATSTSTLQFKLTIPAASLANAKTQLNTEISSYAGQNGGNYTFSIDNLTYVISNFLYTGGILDDLTASRLYANTPGYQSLGSTLDHANPNTAQGAALINSLGNVPTAGLPAALAELSPKSLEVFRNVADDNNTFYRSQIDNHLANLRDGLTGFDSSQLTIDDASMDPALSQVKSRLLAYAPSTTPGLLSDSSDILVGAVDPKDLKSMQQNAPSADRWSSFIGGNVILADLDDHDLSQDSNYTTASVTGGVDYRLDDHFTVGAVLAYAHTDANLDDRGSSATVDSYAPGIYASYVDGGWYANGLATYVRNAYTDDREVNIPGISGDNHGATSGNQGSANLTGGYEFQKGSFKFGPVASLEYVHLSIQSMQEDGPTSLDIDRQDQDSLRSLVGFEGRFVANIHTPAGPMILTPHLSASWQHEYMDDSQGITSQFTGAGGGSFVVQTDNPERDSAFIDVGLDATVSKNVTVFVDYATQVGQQDFFAQSAQGGVRIGF